MVIDKTNTTLVIRTLGLIDYEACLHKMQQHVGSAKPSQQAELWLVEHPSVYSQGQAGKIHHLLNTGKIACVQSDRGGQVTYHGPGQLVCYFLFDLKVLGLNVRQLVNLTEISVIQLLQQLGIAAHADSAKPGVYIQTAKIASLGFRIRRHMSYHGVAINVNMDLSPFAGINPCGLVQPITQIADLVGSARANIVSIRELYLEQLLPIFGFKHGIITNIWP